MICIAQFHISLPKSDIESSIVISNSSKIDLALKEERQYILEIVKKIKKSGCNVLLMQKSIIRESVSDLAQHYLAKANIMLVKDIDRDEIELISKTLHTSPTAHIDHLSQFALTYADVVEEKEVGHAKIVRISGIKQSNNTAFVLVRGSNKSIIDEAERSLRDALSVVKCLIRKKSIVAGGSACEIEVISFLKALSKTLPGIDSSCLHAFAEAIEIIPYTLAENAGLDPVQIISDLRARHSRGNIYDGIDFRKKIVTNMIDQNVVQPLLVTTSALELASECVRVIIKIDDNIKVK